MRAVLLVGYSRPQCSVVVFFVIIKLHLHQQSSECNSICYQRVEKRRLTIFDITSKTSDDFLLPTQKTSCRSDLATGNNSGPEKILVYHK